MLFLKKDNRLLGAVDLSRLFLPQFIGYFDKAEAMPFSYSPQIVYNTVKIAKKRGPLGSIQCFYSFMTRMGYELFT
ncbi:hypothetical protein TUM4261_37240 [Shewanella sp. c952]|nr:hypothetical protein TUM4261_37240 [Shewanella sp. c952]